MGKIQGVRPPPGKGRKRALQGLTPVGKALRFRDADLVSAWERDYSGAVKAAIAGDLKRLVNLLFPWERFSSLPVEGALP